MKNSQGMTNKHSNISSLKRPKMVPFKDNKERGWPSPFGDFKAPSPPLKSLKISVVRRPKHQSLGAHQNGTKWGPLKA